MLIRKIQSKRRAAKDPVKHYQVILLSTTRGPAVKCAPSGKWKWNLAEQIWYLIGKLWQQLSIS